MLQTSFSRSFWGNIGLKPIRRLPLYEFLDSKHSNSCQLWLASLFMLQRPIIWSRIQFILTYNLLQTAQILKQLSCVLRVCETNFYCLQVVCYVRIAFRPHVFNSCYQHHEKLIHVSIRDVWKLADAYELFYGSSNAVLTWRTITPPGLH